MFNFKSTVGIFLLLLLGLIIVDIVIDINAMYYLLLLTLFLIIVIQGVFNISLGFFTPAICKGTISKDVIAITFDDGPVPGKTERLLDILKKHNAPASFFLIGNRIESNTDTVKRIVDEGHIVGNHSYSHTPSFAFKSINYVEDEMSRTDQLLYQLIGKKPRFFRPPYGVTNPNLAAAIQRRNYITLGWSVRSLDTILPKEKVFNRVKDVKKGDIVLFHDHCESTLDLLDHFITYVKSRGMEIVRLDNLIDEEAYS